MSHSAASSATQTGFAPSVTSTWHVGISPVFPSSLVLTNDAAIESLLTDIPFLSVGLLGFGVLTFFFAMRKFNRLSFYILASVIVAFIAGLFDVGQVLTRGRVATDMDINVSSVLPLLVARELALSVSIGIRFFFFWTFVSQPARGELPFLSTQGSRAQIRNFLHMGYDMHSGSWMRLGYVGGFLKYSLLLAVLLIPLLQILWRVVADFSKIGPVYDADSALEVALSVLFTFKLLTNVWLSPLAPRWKTIRDYSPVIVALLISLSIGVGNIIQFQFSETSLGRFFQAIELYILVLYVLISSFYERRTRTSMMDSSMEDRTNEVSVAFDVTKRQDRTPTFQINPTTTSASLDMAGGLAPPRALYSPPENRLSSWLVPETEQTLIIRDTPMRLSVTQRLSSYITGRTNSARQDREQSRPWINKDMESGTSPVDTKARFAAMIRANQRPEGITMGFDAPSSGIRTGLVSADETITSCDAVENYSRGDLTPLPGVPKLPGTPVYGFNGIMGYHDELSRSRPSSVQSLGMESLLRQQAELDRKVAELQSFSPISVVSNDGETVLGGLSSSILSDFSLSNFPEPPPPDVSERLADEDISDVSRLNASVGERAQQAIPPQPIIAEPRMPQSSVQSERRQSVASSSSKSSTGTAVLGVASRTILGPGGYDVTSFISGLTSPASKEPDPQTDESRRFAVERLDAGHSPTSKTRLPVDVTTSAVSQAQALPPTITPEVEASPPTKPSPPRRMKQGLPSGGKLNISGPILQPSIDKATAYERPRAVPQTK